MTMSQERHLDPSYKKRRLNNLSHGAPRMASIIVKKRDLRREFPGHRRKSLLRRQKRDAFVVEPPKIAIEEIIQRSKTPKEREDELRLIKHELDQALRRNYMILAGRKKRSANDDEFPNTEDEFSINDIDQWMKSQVPKHRRRSGLDMHYHIYDQDEGNIEEIRLEDEGVRHVREKRHVIPPTFHRKASSGKEAHHERALVKLPKGGGMAPSNASRQVATTTQQTLTTSSTSPRPSNATALPHVPMKKRDAKEAIALEELKGILGNVDSLEGEDKDREARRLMEIMAKTMAKSWGRKRKRDTRHKRVSYHGDFDDPFNPSGTINFVDSDEDYDGDTPLLLANRNNEQEADGFFEVAEEATPRIRLNLLERRGHMVGGGADSEEQQPSKAENKLPIDKDQMLPKLFEAIDDGKEDVQPTDGETDNNGENETTGALEAAAKMGLEPIFQETEEERFFAIQSGPTRDPSEDKGKESEEKSGKKEKRGQSRLRFDGGAKDNQLMDDQRLENEMIFGREIRRKRDQEQAIFIDSNPQLLEAFLEEVTEDMRPAGPSNTQAFGAQSDTQDSMGEEREYLRTKNRLEKIEDRLIAEALDKLDQEIAGGVLNDGSKLDEKALALLQMEAQNRLLAAQDIDQMRKALEHLHRIITTGIQQEVALEDAIITEEMDQYRDRVCNKSIKLLTSDCSALKDVFDSSPIYGHLVTSASQKPSAHPESRAMANTLQQLFTRACNWHEVCYSCVSIVLRVDLI